MLGFSSGELSGAVSSRLDGFVFKEAQQRIWIRALSVSIRWLAVGASAEQG